MSAGAVAVTDVQGKRGSVPWPESLALTQEIAALVSTHGWPGELAAFHITPDGRVELAETPPADAGEGQANDEPAGLGKKPGASIEALAAFLEELLPAPGQTVEPRIPAGLRYALVRARGGVTAPPYQSPEEFSASLARFEQGNRRVLLERLAGRFASDATPVDVVAEQIERTPRVAPRVEGTPSPSTRWDEMPITSQATAPPVALEIKRKNVDAVAVSAARERRAGPVLTAVALLAILVAAFVVGAAIVVTLDGGAVSWLSLQQLIAGGNPDGADRRGQPAISGTAGTNSPNADAASRGPVDSPPPVASPDSSSVADAAPAPAPAAPAPPRPGEMVEALDVGNRPVFSPSFAADGSAIFFDQKDATGASALKEARTGSGGRVVQVLSVVDDGSRNYHPRLSPDGSQVAFDSDRDGVRGVYLSDRGGRNIRRVSGEGYGAVPTWSPDGARLAFVKAEPDNPRVWNIWTLNLATGETIRVTSYRYGQPWGASWLPDGHRICYSHEDRLIVLDLDSGESATYSSPRKGVLVRTPAVSPDGRRVIFQLHGDGAWMLDLRNGSMRKVLDDPTAEEFAWSPDGARVAFHSRRDRQWGIWVLEQ